MIVVVGLLLAAGQEWYWSLVFQSLARDRERVAGLCLYNQYQHDLIQAGTTTINSP